jgi:hypothetical protein
MAMRSLSPSILLIASLSLGLSLGACELLQPKVSKEKMEAELAAWLKSNDLEATSIVCPDNQKLEKGNVFECTCKIEGIDVPVSVEVTDAVAGTVEWKTKYTTVKDTQIEAGIPALPELAGRTVVVDCPDKVLVSVPNSEWKCNAVDQAQPDAALEVKLKFNDGEGNYEWTLGPKAPTP